MKTRLLTHEDNAPVLRSRWDGRERRSWSEAEASATEVLLHILQEGRVGPHFLVALALFYGELACAARHSTDVLQHLRVLVHAMSLLAVVASMHQVVVGLDRLPRNGQGDEHQHQAQKSDEDVSDHHDRLLGLHLRTRVTEEEEDRHSVENHNGGAQQDEPCRYGFADPERVVWVLKESSGIPDRHDAKQHQEDHASTHEDITRVGEPDYRWLRVVRI
mmetsp:Transcript_52372/g.113487  ORF Transcript_52372/g.113487 Transcript_52372/m.113487 type:complete len:218 (+) Transcript_52372:454-1107(+)